MDLTTHLIRAAMPKTPKDPKPDRSTAIAAVAMAALIVIAFLLAVLASEKCPRPPPDPVPACKPGDPCPVDQAPAPEATPP